MKLNKEESKKLKKIISSFVIVGTLTSNNLTVTENFMPKNPIKVAYPKYIEEHQDEREHFLNHVQFEQERIEYYQNVANADMSQFDLGFVNFYREGKVRIHDEEYDLKTLYLKKVIENDQEKVCLISEENRYLDILTKSYIKDYHSLGVLAFRDAQVFYDLVSTYEITDNTIVFKEEDISDIINYLQSFNFEKHNKVPETYYQQKTFTKEK